MYNIIVVEGKERPQGRMRKEDNMEDVTSKLIDFVLNLLNGLLVWFITTMITKRQQNKGKKKKPSKKKG